MYMHLSRQTQQYWEYLQKKTFEKLACACKDKFIHLRHAVHVVQQQSNRSFATSRPQSLCDNLRTLRPIRAGKCRWNIQLGQKLWILQVKLVDVMISQHRWNYFALTTSSVAMALAPSKPKRLCDRSTLQYIPKPCWRNRSFLKLHSWRNVRVCVHKDTER